MGTMFSVGIRCLRMRHIRSSRRSTSQMRVRADWWWRDIQGVTVIRIGAGTRVIRILGLKELTGSKRPPGRPIRERQGSIINGLAAPPRLVTTTGLHTNKAAAKVPLGLQRCHFAHHQHRRRPSCSGCFRTGGRRYVHCNNTIQQEGSLLVEAILCIILWSISRRCGSRLIGLPKRCALLGHGTSGFVGGFCARSLWHCNIDLSWYVPVVHSPRAVSIRKPRTTRHRTDADTNVQVALPLNP